MKKILLLLMVMMMAVMLMAGCAQSGNEPAEDSAPAFDPSQIKTMGDFYPFATEDNYQESYTEEKYVYGIEIDGNYYRAVVDLPKDVSKELWAIDFEDKDKDAKVKELMSPLELTSLENLTEQVPKQEELDKLVGKKGKELFDDGWTYNYYNLEDMEAGLDHGPYSYIVTFEYDGEQMVNSDDFDFYEEFKDLPVKSITFERIGDISMMD